MNYNAPPSWVKTTDRNLNAKAFGNAMVRISRTFRCAFTDEQLDDWEQLFSNCTTEEFAWGVQYMLEKCKSFPTPAWIFEGIDIYRENITNNGGL